VAFYVGKGSNNRVYKHLKYALSGDPSEKSYKIRKIIKKGEKPRLNIVKLKRQPLKNPLEAAFL